MKLNIVRAWKDEIYRQSLSNEQMDMLPANPVGELELADASLQFVHGTGGGGGAGGAGGAPRVVPGVSAFPHHYGGNHLVGVTGSSASQAFQESFQSLALKCNEAVFSLTSIHGFNVLSPITVFCINEED